MASDKECLAFVSDLDDIACRAMMGESIIYYRGKIIGGIYDNRFWVKPVPSAVVLMPTAEYELPYEGAKMMLAVHDIDRKEFVTNLIAAMYDDLPFLKFKKRRQDDHTDETNPAETYLISCAILTLRFPICYNTLY